MNSFAWQCHCSASLHASTPLRTSRIGDSITRTRWAHAALPIIALLLDAFKMDVRCNQRPRSSCTLGRQRLGTVFPHLADRLQACCCLSPPPSSVVASFSRKKSEHKVACSKTTLTFPYQHLTTFSARNSRENGELLSLSWKGGSD